MQSLFIIKNVRICMRIGYIPIERLNPLTRCLGMMQYSLGMVRVKFGADGTKIRLLNSLKGSKFNDIFKELRIVFISTDDIY